MPAKSTIAKRSKTKEFSFEEACSPMLGKPTVFGDLGVISETVPCGYMQPTKASLAANRLRKAALEAKKEPVEPV